MATHSIVVAWRIPWTEEPGRLQSMGSQGRTRLSDLATIVGVFVMVEITVHILYPVVLEHLRHYVCFFGGAIHKF